MAVKHDPELDDFTRDAPDEQIDTADDDFLEDKKSSGYAEIIRAMFSTRIGKLRKANLNKRQSVALSRAWAFAAMEDVPELAVVADMLADTTVSLGGLGLRQMVQIMAAQVDKDKDDDAVERLNRNLGL